MDKDLRKMMRHVFDPEVVAATLEKLHFDTARMPIKALSLRQLKAAYKVLSQLEGVIAPSSSRRSSGFSLAPRHSDSAKIKELSSQFYTILPHDFGSEAPPVISSATDLKEKMHEMQALTAIVAATSAHSSRMASMLDGVPRTVAQYASLGVHAVPIPPSALEARVLARYIHPPISPSVRSSVPYNLKVLNVFKLDPKDEQRPAGGENTTLLWHGSRVSNIAGILSDGRLRIAPDEAPHTGYNFGKGIYGSDYAAYSAGYAFASEEENIGYLLGVEFDLGARPVTTSRFSEYTSESLQASRHTSVHGVGMYGPSGDVVQSDTGVSFPLGMVQRTRSVISSPLEYSEYVVYSEEHARLRFLVRVEFVFS